jgi:hypothetical protein
MNNQQYEKQLNKMKIALAISHPHLDTGYSGTYFWGLLPREVEDYILELAHRMNMRDLQNEYSDRLTLPRTFISRNPYHNDAQCEPGIRLDKIIMMEHKLNDIIGRVLYRPHTFDTFFNAGGKPYEYGERDRSKKKIDDKYQGNEFKNNFKTKQNRSIWGDGKYTYNSRFLDDKKLKWRRAKYMEGYTPNKSWRFETNGLMCKHKASDSYLLMYINMDTPLKELKRIWKDEYRFKGQHKINNKNKHKYIRALYKYGGDIIWEESDGIF